MDFRLTEDQLALQEGIRSFCEGSVTIERLQQLENGPGFDRDLYRALYSGILAEFRRDDIEFVPHLGVGHFLRAGALYDWEAPRAEDFDEERYRRALERVGNLDLKESFVVDKLSLIAVPNEFIEWATGRRTALPEEAPIREVVVIPLGRAH